MEYGRRLLKPPCETVTLVFDMTGVALKNLDLKSVQFMINTLQVRVKEGVKNIHNDIYLELLPRVSWKSTSIQLHLGME